MRRRQGDFVSEPGPFPGETKERDIYAHCNFIVTGCSGWLGRYTAEALSEALGDEFDRRVFLLGSKAGEMRVAGKMRPVGALADALATVDANPVIVFHYAFLTKDRVTVLGQSEYKRANRFISELVQKFSERAAVAAMVLPSSGAVYDFIQSRSRDPDANIYGALKWEDEMRFGRLAEEKKFTLIVPRIFNLSGVHMNKIDQYALGSICADAARGGPIRIRADRPVLRSYVDIGDLVEFCIRLSLCMEGGSTTLFDTAGDRVIEIGELAQLASEVLSGGKMRIERPVFSAKEPDYYVGDRATLDVITARTQMVWRPLEEQIRITGEYVKNRFRSEQEPDS